MVQRGPARGRKRARGRGSPACTKESLHHAGIRPLEHRHPTVVRLSNGPQLTDNDMTQELEFLRVPRLEGFTEFGA